MFAHILLFQEITHRYLYDFNLSTDLIYDTMHILAICVSKSMCPFLVQTFTDLGREKDLEEALRIVSQPAYRPKWLGQRWPTSLNALRFFKAKEYTNFILWCLPFILEKLQIEKHSVLESLEVLFTEVGRFFFVNTRNHGLSGDNLTLGKKLLNSWRVRSEEGVGPNNVEHDTCKLNRT